MLVCSGYWVWRRREDKEIGMESHTPMPCTWPEEDEEAEDYVPSRQVSLNIPVEIGSGAEHEAVKFLKKPIPVVEHFKYFGSGFRNYGDS